MYGIADRDSKSNNVRCEQYIAILQLTDFNYAGSFRLLGIGTK